MQSPEERPIPPLTYLLTDTSGSTVRGSFIQGWNLALPEVISTIEAIAGFDARLCLLSYDTQASVISQLSTIADLAVIPVASASGFSSLAAGLELLARTVQDDIRHLDADAMPHGPVVLIVFADGLPTDPDEDVLRARAQVDDLGGVPIEVHLAMPDPSRPMTVAGLRARGHRIDTGDTREVANSIVAVVREALTDAIAPTARQ